MGWTALLVTSLLWDLDSEQQQLLALARETALASFNKDLVYRRWAAGHGGVYAPVNDATPPNPYLAAVPERDIETPAGTALTLINPAYMTRQVHELAADQYGVVGHITSLRPINPTNLADAWERAALERFERGEQEVVGVEPVDGEPHLRFMRRLIVEDSCLKCHADQGYQEGDVRGGISVSVPLASHYAAHWSHAVSIGAAHLVMWLAGLLLFFVAAWRISRQLDLRAAAEAALLASEERFELAAHGSSAGLWDWPNIEQDSQWWSAQWYQLLGYRDQEIEASDSRFWELVHPDDRQRLERATAVHFETRAVFDIETRLQTKRGEYKWFRTRAQARWDERGRPTRISGSITDIDREKRSQRAVEIAGREWSAAMEASADVIYLLDVDRRVIRANSAFFRMTRSTPESAIGTHIAELVHPEGEVVPCPVCLAQEEKRDDHIVMEADHPDNPAGRPIEIVIKVVRDEQEIPTSIFMTLHDLTASRQEQEERQRLEERLRQAQKMEAIGTLAGGIAHDFNNILSPILGYTGLALSLAEPSSDLHEDLTQVMQASRRAKLLVHQILTFSRQRECERQTQRLQTVVEEAFVLLRASIPATISIERDIDLECGPVLADPTELHQVIINLCGNASDAMRAHGGALSIGLREISLPDELPEVVAPLPPGRYAELTVSDTGEGIPAEVRSRIFEPYFSTKASEGRGTGLGLSVVHGIVTSCGGHIRVESVVGQGTTFLVYLPVVSPDAQLPAAEEQDLPRGTERILFVDDEEVIVQMNRKLLQRLGYSVVGYADPERALARFRSQPEAFDLVISDVTMPKLTGIELTRELLRIVADLPVILLSGFNDRVRKESVRETGARLLLLKPLMLDELAMAIREVLDAED